MSLSRAEEEDQELSWQERIREALLPEPDAVARLDWLARCATLAVLVLWTGWIARHASVRDGEPGSAFLHLVLLPFHEAGHVLLRPFGTFTMILGGSIGQLLMPIVAAVALRVQRADAFGAAVCTWLLGFSVIDMAVYMYDAYDPKLILLNGRTGAESDMHDWQNLFGDMGLLARAQGIGRFFGLLGGATMLASLVWAFAVLLQQRSAIGDRAA